jgi:hypothetical protein
MKSVQIARCLPAFPNIRTRRGSIAGGFTASRLVQRPQQTVVGVSSSIQDEIIVVTTVCCLHSSFYNGHSLHLQWVPNNQEDAANRFICSGAYSTGRTADAAVRGWHARLCRRVSFSRGVVAVATNAPLCDEQVSRSSGTRSPLVIVRRSHAVVSPLCSRYTPLGTTTHRADDPCVIPHSSPVRRHALIRENRPEASTPRAAPRSDHSKAPTIPSTRQ